MRKYITCLIGILCMAFTGVCFAGKNEITHFDGTLVGIYVTHESGTTYTIQDTDHVPISLGMTKDFPIVAGEGEGQLPYGKYKDVTYVFKNEFTVAGTVTLADGVYVSDHYDSGIGKIFFTKGSTTAKNCTYVPYVYNLGSTSKFENCDETGWAQSRVNNGNIEFRLQNDPLATFTLDKDSANNFTPIFIDLRNLWFGPGRQTWSYFDELLYIVDEADAGTHPNADECFKRRDANTIFAPFIQAPKIKNKYYPE